MYNGGEPIDFRTLDIAPNIVFYAPIGLAEDTADLINDLSSNKNHVQAALKYPAVLFQDGSSNYLEGATTALGGLTEEFSIACLYSPRFGAGGVTPPSNMSCFFAKDKRTATQALMFQHNLNFQYVWDNATSAYFGQQANVQTVINSGTSGRRWQMDWIGFSYSDSGPTSRGYWRGENYLVIPDAEGAPFVGGTFNSINSTSAPLQIGGWTGGTGSYERPVDGWQTCVVVWNKLLTDAEWAEIGNQRVRFNPLVNSGDYVSAANVVNLWLYKGQEVDLTVADGVPAFVGSEDLTGNNMLNSAITDIFSTDVA